MLEKTSVTLKSNALGHFEDAAFRPHSLVRRVCSPNSSEHNAAVSLLSRATLLSLTVGGFPESVPGDSFQVAKARVEHWGTNDYYGRWAHWLLQERFARPVKSFQP